MDVEYDQRRRKLAIKLRMKEHFIEQERIQREIKRKKLAEFNENIRKDDGKLSFSELKRLNTIYKQNYIQMIAEEDDEVKQYLHKTKDNLEHQEDEVNDMLWKIEDTVGTWEESVT